MVYEFYLNKKYKTIQSPNTKNPVVYLIFIILQLVPAKKFLHLLAVI